MKPSVQCYSTTFDSNDASVSGTASDIIKTAAGNRAFVSIPATGRDEAAESKEVSVGISAESSAVKRAVKGISMIRRLKPRVTAILAVFLLVVSSALVKGQNKFALGVQVEPVFCFTDLTPRLDGLQRTSPRYWDLVNFGAGFRVDYEMESGFSFTSGLDIKRKRFGFMHEESLDGADINLWGHSEFVGVSLPVMASYTVVTAEDPFYEIAPMAGISVGRDFSSYRNLTRMDENYDYTYLFDRHGYTRRSTVVTAHAGAMMRTIIEQLGVIHWGVVLSADLTTLPSFDYEVDTGASTSPYSQDIRMIYLSLNLTYYFMNYEVFDGRFLRRRYD